MRGYLPPLIVLGHLVPIGRTFVEILVIFRDRITPDRLLDLGRNILPPDRTDEAEIRLTRQIRRHPLPGGDLQSATEREGYIFSLSRWGELIASLARRRDRSPFRFPLDLCPFLQVRVGFH